MAGVDGTYNVTVTALEKSTTGTLSIEERGTAIRGTVDIIGQTLPIEKGKIKGNEITGKVVARLPKGKGKLKIGIRATVDGDIVTGTLKAVIGKADFSGIRVA